MALLVAEHFADLPDPRTGPAQRHLLLDILVLDILVIALCALICGADTFVDIARFGEAKLDWLQAHLGLELPSGIPSHDTFMIPSDVYLPSLIPTSSVSVSKPGHRPCTDTDPAHKNLRSGDCPRR